MGEPLHGVGRYTLLVGRVFFLSGMLEVRYGMAALARV